MNVVRCDVVYDPETTINLVWCNGFDSRGDPMHGPGGWLHDLGTFRAREITHELLSRLEAEMTCRTCLPYGVYGQTASGGPIDRSELAKLAEANRVAAGAAAVIPARGGKAV